jgi:chromosome segregation ATPase
MTHSDDSMDDDFKHVPYNSRALTPPVLYLNVAKLEDELLMLKSNLSKRDDTILELLAQLKELKHEKDSSQAAQLHERLDFTLAELERARQHVQELSRTTGPRVHFQSKTEATVR